MTKYKEGQTMIETILHEKLQIEQHDSNYKPGSELKWSGRVLSSCSTSGTNRVTLVRNPVISRERGKKHGIVNTTNGTDSWLTVTQIFLG